MPYKVPEAAWVAQQAERCKGIILLQVPYEQAWPDTKLRELLAQNGLDYSMSDFQLIRDKLVADGILAPVP